VIHATDFYVNVLKPQDTEEMVGLVLPMYDGIDTGGVSIAFDGRDDAAPRAGLALLNLMAPYLRRAMAANLHLRTESVREQGLAAALDRMPSAVFLLTQQSRVVFANRRAEHLLGEHDGLVVVNGELAGAQPADTRALRRLVGEAGQAAAGRVPSGPDAVSIARPSGKPPLSVLAAPVRELDARMMLPEAPVTMLIVTDPHEACESPSRAACRLGTLFGLTPSEAKVALLVALGMSGPEAAGELGIGPGTVHAHLKSVFAKTGVRRQSGLARLLTRTGVLDLN
jgi:DNA-binding CsgD family transcriptional regulator/PAS domain-containing protein